MSAVPTIGKFLGELWATMRHNNAQQRTTTRGVRIDDLPDVSYENKGLDFVAEATYSTQVIVLRKTKLGESDLILTMLASDGSQVRAVAKGARKPQNSFASRLELYCICDVLIASGKNLDIIKEARLLFGHEKLRDDLQRMSAAACVCELCEHISQTGLAVPRFFELTAAALEALEKSQSQQIALITAAYFLKAFAFSGIKPSFDSCILCGTPLDISSADSLVHFSFEDGGVICKTCLSNDQSTLIPKDIIECAQALLYATFDDVATIASSQQTDTSLLQFCQQWTGFHVGCKIKSLRFLLTLEQ